MTDEEIERVAELLAKVGGSWFPERTGPALRVVNNRHRDVARLILAEIERTKAAQEEAAAASKASGTDSPARGDTYTFANEGQLHVGAMVVYRPPGEKRAVTCKIEKMDHGRAYLVPMNREIGWVSTHTLLPLKI